MGDFFRYSYIIDSRHQPYTRIAGKTIYGRLSVNYHYFGFWNSKSEHEDVGIDKARTWYKLLAPSWWGPPDVAQEEATVLSQDAVGLGFYYGAILVEWETEKPYFRRAEVVEKFHLRRRLKGRSFFTRVIEAVGRLWREGI